MEIAVSKLTSDHLTSSGGLIVGKEIANSIRRNPFQNIEVSFDRVEYLAPSFINGAFFYVIDLFGDVLFKQRVKVIKASSSVADVIRNSVKEYIDLRARFFEEIRSKKIYVAVHSGKKGQDLLQHFEKLASEKGLMIEKILPNTSIQRETIVLIMNVYGKDFTELEKYIYKATDVNCKVILVQSEESEIRIPTHFHEKILPYYFNRNNLVNKIEELSHKLSGIQISPTFNSDEDSTIHEPTIIYNNTSLPINTTPVFNKNTNTANVLVGLALIALIAAMFSDEE